MCVGRAFGHGSALPRRALDRADDFADRCRSGRYCRPCARRSRSRDGVLLRASSVGRLHDLAGLAVAALRHLLGDPGLLQRMAAVGRQPFDGGDGFAFDQRTPGVAQERIGLPSMCTVQAPHDAMPQPNLVPVSLRCSRRTQSSGVSGSTPSSLRTPLTVKATMRFLQLSVKTIFRIRNDVFGTARRRLNMVPDCRRMVADLRLVREGGCVVRMGRPSSVA